MPVQIVVFEATHTGMPGLIHNGFVSDDREYTALHQSVRCVGNAIGSEWSSDVTITTDILTIDILVSLYEEIIFFMLNVMLIRCRFI